MAAPGFWDEPVQAQDRAGELARHKQATAPYLELETALEEARLMLELLAEEEGGTADSDAELDADLERLSSLLDDLEVQALLSGEHDGRDAFLSVQAGAGGTDACDWVEMLVRMYVRYAEQQGWKIELVDSLDGEEAGKRRVTLRVSGNLAYGYLRSEIGVHRLVRISPFDASARRHTAFAAVDVMPVVEDSIDIDLRKEDLRIDHYCSGGAGGQHVNRTMSAVRITHLPTGVVAQCQNERSSFRNLDIAMEILRSRLVHLEERKRNEELAALYSAKGEIAFGNQIRSYVLHPYTMVNDHRTSTKTANIQAVLDGDLQEFITAELRRRTGSKRGSRARRPG
jgi:peptide chain release factor 2